MKKVFGFGEQLSIGNLGEQDFLKYYKELSPKKSLDDKAIDFTLGDGKLVELKSDSYDLNLTPNFFIEMYGNVENSSFGGPFKAMKDKIDFFVYYFPKNKTFFWFDTVKLCYTAEKIILDLKLKPKYIRNKTWTTLGYAINRDSLKEILIKTDIFN